MVDDGDDEYLTGSFWENFSLASPSVDNDDDSLTDDTTDDGVVQVESSHDYPSADEGDETEDDSFDN